MRKKINLTASVLLALLLGIFLLSAAKAQTTPSPSLNAHLNARYKVGAILVVQKSGIVSVSTTEKLVTISTYKDGDLHPPGRLQVMYFQGRGLSTRNFAIGEKVNLQSIGIDLKRDKLDFMLIECGSCSGSAEQSSYKAAMVFQFPKGYLATAEPSKVQEVIDQVLPFDTTTNKRRVLASQAAIVSVFISQEDPKDSLELRDDKSCRLIQRGAPYLGQYEWSGDTLTLIFGTKRNISHLAGDILTDPGGKLWRTSTNSAAVGASQAVGETPMAEPPPPPLPPSAEPQTPPKTIEVGQTIEQVVAALGQPAKIVKLGTKELYFYKDLKITFVNGKVSDVE